MAVTVRSANCHEGPSAVADLLVGVASGTAQATERYRRVAIRIATPLARWALRPSPLPERYWPDGAVRAVVEHGRQERARMTAGATQVLRQLVPRVLDAVLDEVDLTRLVTERVDLDEVARHLDLDAAAARIDIDAILDRVDLIGLARYVIDGVDLPEIIRGSTGTMASEGLRGVRMQAIDADERVNRLVDRMLLRRQARRTQAPEAATGGESTLDGDGAS